VVDLTRILSGPFCPLLVADMGAQISKVEPPSSHPLRKGAMAEGLRWYFAAFNHNKRSIGLNCCDTCRVGGIGAPEVGAHTVSRLPSVSYSAEEIAELSADCDSGA
jgi:crotonobetainyl-CoA:carnitine CoA-transferase CaiB-like acyl-CoA transferase